MNYLNHAKSTGPSNDERPPNNERVDFIEF
jgi:hypothetical protein